MARRGISRGGWLLILGIGLVVIDQVIKILVKTNMTIGEEFNVIGSWFRILFVENKGMAFGMSFGGVVGKYFLTVFRLCLFVVLVWWISKLLKRGKPSDTAVPSASSGPKPVPTGPKPVPTGVLVGLTLITAGALGNIIDCLFYGLIFSESTTTTVATLGSYAPFMQGKVVDMLYFPLWRWPSWMPLVGGDIFFEPIFNFADSCVTVGAFYLIIFHWKFFSKE